MNNVDSNKEWSINSNDSIDVDKFDSSRILVLDDKNTRVNTEIIVSL